MTYLHVQNEEVSFSWAYSVFILLVLDGPKGQLLLLLVLPILDFKCYRKNHMLALNPLLGVVSNVLGSEFRTVFLCCFLLLSTFDLFRRYKNSFLCLLS